MRPLVPLALVCLVLGAGCLAPGPAGPSPTHSPTASSPDPSDTLSDTPSPSSPTASATESPPEPTDTVSAASAGERAIDAEAERIRRVVDDWENLTMLSIGDIEPAEYTIEERNETGVVVTVTVGHSMSFACDYHVDGATTKARYFVTQDSVDRLAVLQDVYGREHRPCS